MIHHKEFFSDISQFTNYLCTVPARLLSHSILNFSYYAFLFLVSLISFFQICCFLYHSQLSTTFLKFCFSPPWTNKYSDFEICLTILVNFKDSLGLFVSWQIRGVLFPSLKSSSVFISSSHCGALGGTDRQIWTVSLDAAPWRLGRRERGRENRFWSRNSVTGSAMHKETDFNYFEGKLNSGEPAPLGGLQRPSPIHVAEGHLIGSRGGWAGDGWRPPASLWGLEECGEPCTVLSGAQALPGPP